MLRGMSEEHCAILDQGVEAWNSWRKLNPDVQPDLASSNLINRDLSRADLSGANLSGADLSKAQLSHASLRGANLDSATLILADLLGAILNEANLSGASLFGAFLFGTRLKGANLAEANLMGTSLMGADLTAAKLTGAHLMGANFHDANLTRADLTNANLTAASLVGATIREASLSDCSVYGVSACNLEGEPATESNLTITPLGEAPIAVDGLQSAQLVYLLLSGESVSDLLTAVESRLVLVVGSFRADRQSVLDAIRCELRDSNYTAIVAPFTHTTSRELSPKVQKLAKFARFVIADFSDSTSVVQLISDLSSSTTPILPLQQVSAAEPEIVPAKLEQALIPLRYRSADDLRQQLKERLEADLS